MQLHAPLLDLYPHIRAKVAVIVAMTAVTAQSLAAAESDSAAARVRSEDGPGFVSLFDGKTLQGWSAADRSWWSVEDNAITAKITDQKPCEKNQYLFLICKGPRLTLRVNGRLIAEVIDNDPKQRDLSGLLALQLHSGPAMTVQFRDIRYKRLPLAGAADSRAATP